MQAAVWDVNAFDQWGVELGKRLAEDLLPVVTGAATAAGKDSSTRGLVARIRALNED